MLIRLLKSLYLLVSFIVRLLYLAEINLSAILFIFCIVKYNIIPIIYAITYIEEI